MKNLTPVSEIKKGRRSWERVLATLSTMWRMRSCEKFIPLSFPVTGLKCSYGKIFSPLNEVPVGNPRSREPSQPALSYEPIKNFTKGLEVRRDLGNRTCLVDRADVKRPLVTGVFCLSTDNLILRSYELGEGRLLVCNVYYSRSILINYRKGKYASYQLLYRCFLDHVIIPSNICRCLNRGSHLTA